MGFYEQFVQIAERSVAGGYVFALALICMIQYTYQVYRNIQSRRLREQFRSEVKGLEATLEGAQKDRSLTRLENHILREFVSQTEIEKALSLLLRRFVSNSKEGFGAIVQFDRGRAVVTHSRGLDDGSSENLSIDGDVLEEVQQHGIVVLEDVRLRESGLLASLSQGDRGKVRRLFLVAVGERDEMAGLLVSTSLFPAGAPREHQMELAVRLMQSVAGNLKRTQTLEQQEHRLRMSSEMLELRSISDRPFETPLMMIEEFLNCLLQKVGAQRAVLYLVGAEAPSRRQTPSGVREQPRGRRCAAADGTRSVPATLAGGTRSVPATVAGGTRSVPATEGGAIPRPLVRCGTLLQPGLQNCWEEHEDRLGEAVLRRPDVRSFDEERLRQIGVESLIRSALAVPLGGSRTAMGVLCLTRREPAPFSRTELQLACWAAEHLADSILRAVNQAVVERQAQLDGLTELANRRVFDRRIQDEVRSAHQSRGECTLLLFDLDRFKSINDTYGHQAGDEVLRVTARILREEVAKSRSESRALIARYGGEELAVLLPGFGAPAAVRVAEAIRAAVAATSIRFQQQEVRATLSVGLAAFPAHAGSVEELIAAADAALYQAKAGGRNRVCSRPEAFV